MGLFLLKLPYESTNTKNTYTKELHCQKQRLYQLTKEADSSTKKRIECHFNQSKDEH